MLPPTSGGLPVRRSGTAGGGLVYRQRCRPRPTRVGGRAASPEPVDVVTWSWPASGRAGRRAFSSVPAQPGSLGVNLPVGNVTETEVVTAAPLVVDVTSAVVAEAITLDLTSGRSYQSCPWLVPGVLSEDADAPGNPASKSGADILRVASTMAAGTMRPSQLLRKLAAYPRQKSAASNAPCS